MPAPGRSARTGRASSAMACPAWPFRACARAPMRIDGRAAPVPVGCRGHPRAELADPLPASPRPGPCQGILGALVVQELPALRHAGQPREQRAASARASPRPRRARPTRPGTGPAPARQYTAQRELPVRFGGLGLAEEQRDRGGVVAEQERGDGRVGGGGGRNAVAGAVDGGDGVAREVTATGEPAGLVQDLQRVAPPGQVERHAGVGGVGGLPAVEVEQGQRRPVCRVVAARPGRARSPPRRAATRGVAARGGQDGRDLGDDRLPQRRGAMATASSKRSAQARATARRPSRSARRSSPGGRRSPAICRNVACSSCAPAARASSAASNAGSDTGGDAGQRRPRGGTGRDLRRADPARPPHGRRPAPQRGRGAAAAAATGSAPGRRPRRISAWVKS